MLGDGPALLGIQDIELLDILKVTCEVMGVPHEGRKPNPQTMQPSKSPTLKANKAQQIKKNNADVHDANSNMPDSFRSSIQKAADKWASQV